MALVIWGAIHAKGLKDLLHYVDDVFSYELTSDLMYYPPYNKKLPSKQARLLKLWDEIGLPHEEKKQEYGLSLEILGMQVDTECMTITIPLASKQEIVALVTAFIDVSQSRMRSVEEWKKVVARLNWGLTVEPLLRPALQSSHSKLSGKTNPKELLELDDDVVSDLKWIADMFAFSTGINIMDEKDWRPETADLIMFCDATLYGLGYWSQTDRLGFYAEIPRNIPNFGATYNECHAVVSALEWASRRFNRPHRVLIWTDSMNVVTMFDKLKALQGCNDLLFAAVKILIRSNISLRIFHLPREENVVADALSRGALDEVHSIHPSLKLSMFRPTSYTGKERLY
ncbi:hypothetical protein BOTBODRAFT_28385 [Botryobasidium botryosum FD-172 SS1]|uniref:Uncharacterized protein n=1 Tax=Botryobasidium botryosum (strain FD-172 SS1) TaxID=930990 RepID=A0A067MW44_BOTB1|nr:hypothetical protein BOTBODRAFT_28385 [Botryobasidium botryosum FD-172 SS1]